MILYLNVAILLFICIIICGVLVWKDEENMLTWSTICSICGIGCLISIGLYFGGM